MREKINKKILTLVLLFGLVVIVVNIFSLRKISIEESIKEAKSIAETIKAGLTAHMVNGNMEQRGVFLKSINELNSVKKVWIIRGENVVKQYGEGNNLENPKDEIDKKVLKEGKLLYKLHDSFTNTSIRVTIPYKAIPSGDINCLNCHNAKYGDTLGAVSVVLDISELKSTGLENSIIIIIITIIVSFIILYRLSNILKPYIKVLETLNKKIYDSANGDFQIAENEKNSSEFKEINQLVQNYNILAMKFKQTFTDIDNKLKVFVGSKVGGDIKNPFEESIEIIDNLSNLYQYKKEIQLDSKKCEIYDRFAQICKNKFDIKYLNIFEIGQGKYIEKVYSMGDRDFCFDAIKDEPNRCRVSKNDSDVFSVDYHKACPCFKNDELLYYCIDIEIGKSYKMIANFIFEDQKEFEKFKSEVSYIRSYIQETAPEVSNKLLMQALEDSAFKDELTGLYNRKYFNEYIKKLIPYVKRENIKIGILMCDLDKFKSVNDEYGHDIGDKVLKETSFVLEKNVRNSDIVFRMGGEEFVILLVGVKSKDDAIEVANKIRIAVSENEIDIYAGSVMRKTISMGLSMFPEDGTSMNNLLKYADLALYEAKNSGRNKTVVYEAKPKDSVELF